MTLAPLNVQDSFSGESIVKDLSADASELLCDDIAQSLTDAEISTKEVHCIADVWGVSETPEACEQAVSECIAQPGEEFDNIDAEKQSSYDYWFSECKTDFVNDSATYTVKELEACTDAMAEASSCIYNNDKITCDTVSLEAANELSSECAALDDQADTLCAIVG